MARDRWRWSAIAVLVSMACAQVVPALAQVSPGPLSRAHAALEGIRRCRDCHGGGNEVDEKCLQCHADLAWTIEQGRGLHAREGRTACAQCHPEHGGVDFALVDWGRGGREAFDHARTGWALAGAHAPVKCESCHTAERRIRAVDLRRPEGSDDSTWLGLDTTCRTCHADVHGARLGLDCESCHTANTFTAVAKFDHVRTGYPLRGKHATIECAACHRQGRFGTTTREGATRHLAPIAHDDCNACHRDAHQGRFGTTCARCHVETGFRDVSKDTFDHDRTRYPLRGAHVRVTCARCHEPEKGGWGQKPAFDTCQGCHDDAHAGTATLAAVAVDCAACHTVGGFAPSTFTVAQHADSRFALEGKHAVVTCAACHRRSTVDLTRFGRAKVELHPPASQCRDCHVDAHGAQLARREDGGACESCHGVQAWVPSTFTVARHDATSFALTGAHAAAACRSCHGPDRTGLRALDPAVDRGTARIALVLDERTCADCHHDVHQGRYSDAGARSALGPCSKCHGNTSFVPSRVDIDDHDAYAFRLEGAHRATPCIFCHTNLDGRRHLPENSHALVGESGLDDVVLWKVPSACQDCHRPGGR